MSIFSQIFLDFFTLFIPAKCINCGLNLNKYEKYVCQSCLYKIPKTNFFDDLNNPVSQIFWGRVNLERTFAYYYFTKGGCLQKLVHEIKYRGAKDLAFQLGRDFGTFLSEKSTCKFDLVCPVPLHRQKEKLRGYNQSDWLARGLSSSLGIGYEKDLLKRKVFTSTQTKKNRQQRWDNVKDAFELGNKSLAKNKHILLVDDVLTTGATLEACAMKLLEIEGSRVSVATLAYANDI